MSLSARALAECADLDLTHLQRLEKGTGNPTLYTLVQIAVALEVDPAELLSDVGPEDLPGGRRPYGYSQREQHRRQPRSWSEGS